MIPRDTQSKRSDDCSSQRSNIQDMRRFLFAGKVQAVGQDETALRVRVIDHDRLAVLCVEDVSRPLGIRIGKFSAVGIIPVTLI